MKYIIITSSALLLFLAAFAFVPNISGKQAVDPPYKYYKIIKAATTSNLSAEVTHEMENGWQPTGGVAHVNGEFLQSITK